jgi:hypothetical protein
MTLLKWTFWKMCLLALPLALAVPGQSDAVPCGKAKGIVFVADGAAGQGLLVDRLNELVNNPGLPLNVQQVYWSTLNEPTDFQSQYNFAVTGKQLAGRIMEMRRTCPTQKIYLVGYGAGTTVILKAAEQLPPNSVTRIILLAPSVCCSYDLRPALNSSCEGIDSFYSPNDEILRLAIRKYGTTDVGVRGATSAAGLSGFHVMNGTPQDQALYAKLRQHRLVESPDRQIHSGHLGYMNPNFLRTRVVSIFEASLLGTRPQTIYSPAPQYPTPPVPPSPPTPPGYAPHCPSPTPQYSPAPVPQYPPSYPPAPAPVPHYPPPATVPHCPSPTPQYSPVPVPQYPPAPAPHYPPPYPPTPAPHYPPLPAPQSPMPQTPPAPAPQYPPPPAPQSPMPQTPPVPAPQYPPPPAPQSPMPQTPSVPAPQYPPAPAPQLPAPQFSAPQGASNPLPRGPQVPVR